MSRAVTAGLGRRGSLVDSAEMVAIGPSWLDTSAATVDPRPWRLEMTQAAVTPSRALTTCYLMEAIAALTLPTTDIGRAWNWSAARLVGELPPLGLITYERKLRMAPAWVALFWFFSTMMYSKLTIGYELAPGA